VVIINFYYVFTSYGLILVTEGLCLGVCGQKCNINTQWFPPPMNLITRIYPITRKYVESGVYNMFYLC